MPGLLDGSKHRSVVFLPAGLKQATKNLATETGVSFGSVVRSALNHWVVLNPDERGATGPSATAEPRREGDGTWVCHGGFNHAASVEECPSCGDLRPPAGTEPRCRHATCDEFETKP